MDSAHDDERGWVGITCIDRHGEQFGKYDEGGKKSPDWTATEKHVPTKKATCLLSFVVNRRWTEVRAQMSLGSENLRQRLSDRSGHYNLRVEGRRKKYRSHVALQP